MKRVLPFIFALFFALLVAEARNDEQLIIDTVGIRLIDSIDIQNYSDRIDYLVSDWLVNNSFAAFDTSFRDSVPVTYDDTVYIKRLQRISEETVIELPFNSKVKAYIELYTMRKREQTSSMLGLSEFYFPMFEEELDRQGLPLELKYMAIIESALNPRAFSRAGASGLWQFMYSTGKIYKLNVTTYVDERRDPLKSTVAAARFLKDLYAIYNDWYLVIAAYNCGPGNVNKAIRRAGGQKDYWAIYDYLPRETRGYVPAFIGATYAMKYAYEHNIYPIRPNFPLHTDTMEIRKPVHFEQISQVTGINIETLRNLNPQYRIDIIPGGSTPYILRLPIEFTGSYIDLQDSIFNFKNDFYFAKKRVTVEPSSGYYSTSGKSKTYYTVRAGDNLGAISQRYKVSINDLRRWNNISHNLIRVGQKLVVYVPDNSGGAGSSLAQNHSEDDSFYYYKVKSGDNLWSISRRYPGVSAEDIKSLNGISNNIKPGQILKIRKRG
jgi:membrane-bound lytic murein transglycosylase D